MSTVRLRLFGRPCAQGAGVDRPLGASRPVQLLVHLAVAGGWQDRDDLAALFWPGRPTRIARSNLRNLLSKLPAAAPFLAPECAGQALRLKVASDLEDFDAALRRRDWEAAACWGEGELLQGLEHEASEPFVQWLRAERDLRLAQWVQALLALLAQADRPIEQRESLAAAWALRCPLDEDAVRARLALAHERRSGAAAARLYAAFEVRLQHELGVRPSAELGRLVHAAPADAAHLAPASRPPALQGSMVGRRWEMGRLMHLLHDDAVRLVTLTGPGGVGKSTLLAAAHQRWRDAGGADAFLVDVGHAPDARSALAAVAAALGVAGDAGEPGHALLADALGERRWLLMIDGAEQPGLATPLAQLLERCPQARWVLASRQRLHLDHEHVMVLDGFPLPDADETDPELLAAHDGVRFLADVATRTGRAVDLARDAGVLAAIVRAVDGLPLALRLLGRLAHLYTLAQLLEGVQPQRGGDAAGDALAFAELMPSLLASFRRSWASLSGAEQAVLGRLAVFPAPFEVAAARWVGRTELPLITALVDRSLLRAEGDGRLSLHGAIRSCVRALVPQAAADAEAGYLAYYTQRLRALAGQARARTLRPMRQFLASDRVHADHAWALALQRHDHAALLAMQESTWWLDDGASAEVEFSARCHEAERLTRHDPARPAALHALLLGGIARDLLNQRRLAEALAHARRALREAQRARHAEAVLAALNTLFFAHVVQRQLAQADQVRLRQEAALRHVDEGVFALWPVDAVCMLAAARGDLEACIVHFGRLAELSRAIEDRHSEIHSLVNSALACHRFGQPGRALPYEDEAFAKSAAGGVDPAGQVKWLSELALWHVHRGDLVRAEAYVARATALSQAQPQMRLLRLKLRLALAALRTAQGRLAAAREPLADLLERITGEDLPAVASTTLVIGARWLRAAGDRASAAGAARAALAAPFAYPHDRKVASALLQELAEPPPPADGTPAPDPAAFNAAAVAARTALQAARVG